ncbi:MAG: hypothetical protein IJX89_03625 [Alphaproteobacteria bacterium]|nr:hypothetical protein [Alphaproteobacteria bacterium]
MLRVFLFVLFTVMGAHAESVSIAGTSYVDTAVSSKVDTAATASQEMAGSYTVSGTLVVPTPPLPTAE